MVPAYRPARAHLGLAIVCLGALLAPFDTAVNTAFPVITQAFALPLRDIQWVVIPFALAQMSLALIFGHLGDRLGHRRVFAIGLAASVFAHAAVALAPGYWLLVWLRVAQGMAIGITVACAPALATLLYPPAGKARAISRYAAAFSAAMALGPWIGGLLLQAFGWPGVFWFRVPLALLALLALPLMPALFAAPAREAETAGTHFDWFGALGLTTVLSLLALATVALTRPEGPGLLAPVLAGLGLLGGALFVRHELRVAHPVLRIGPFRSRRFSGIQAASVALNCAGFANLLLIPYVLTGAAGASIATAGAVISTYPGGAVLGSLWAGRLTHRLSSERLMSIGLLVATAGLLATASLLHAGPALLPIGASMLACGLGLGLFQVGYMDATTSLLPIEERGTAGSLVSVTRLIGIVFGASGIGWLRAATGADAESFALLGAGLGLLAVAFALAERRRPATA